MGNTSAKLPVSCVRWIDPLLSAAAAAGSYVAFRAMPWTNTDLALAIVAAVAAVLALAEIAEAPWVKQRVPSVSFEAVMRRAAVKWLGVMAGMAAVILAWFVLPEYARDGYQPMFDAMRCVLPWLPAVCAAWILFAEWRLGPDKDYSWHIGMLVLGQRHEVDWKQVRNGALAWLVRGFFLPLNFCAFVTFLGMFRGAEAAALSGSWPHMQYGIILMLSSLLAAAIIPGYFFSARLLGTDVRKVEASWFGWAVTLACYPPLMTAVFGSWLNFYGATTTNAQPWTQVMGGSAAGFLGLLILFFEIIHYWGEAAFGLRASNLSNRGIITNGPYRFVKHPVYLVKCLSWLLVWMPFLAGDTLGECFRLTLGWIGCCAIYLMRAWVEERLLSDDPDYVAYALWMDRNGLLAPLGRWMPLFSYEWRLKRWKNVF